MLRIKRVYEPPSPEDGTRILIDRLWPRGLSKEAAAVDEWVRNLAPSSGLRKWFGHDPGRWNEFRRRFFRELQDKGGQIEALQRQARKGTVTLVYGSREETYNNAAALKDYIEGRMHAGNRRKAA